MLNLAFARHVIGRALGAVPVDGGSSCACCGASPFGPARPAADVVATPNFTDHDLMTDLDADDVCEGCARMMGGSPNKENPPLRMASFWCPADGSEVVRLGIDELRELLNRDADGVLGWAVSRQKHASLRCGAPLGRDWLIGFDDGQIRWTAADRQLLVAVEHARMTASREEILTGQYRAHAMQAGGARLLAAEGVIAHYRGSPHLSLAVAVVRRPDPSTVEESAMPTRPRHEAVAEIVAELSKRSQLRARDGLAFWHDILPRRLTMAGSSRDLPSALARLMRDLLVTPISDGANRAVELVEAMTADEAREALGLMRTDARVIVTLAFRALKEQREAAEVTP